MLRMVVVSEQRKKRMRPRRHGETQSEHGEERTAQFLLCYLRASVPRWSHFLSEACGLAHFIGGHSAQNPVVELEPFAAFFAAQIGSIVWLLDAALDDLGAHEADLFQSALHARRALAAFESGRDHRDRDQC